MVQHSRGKSSLTWLRSHDCWSRDRTALPNHRLSASALSFSIAKFTVYQRAVRHCITPLISPNHLCVLAKQSYQISGQQWMLPASSVATIERIKIRKPPPQSPFLTVDDQIQQMLHWSKQKWSIVLFYQDILYREITHVETTKTPTYPAPQTTKQKYLTTQTLSTPPVSTT
jgi:hypothetical protein